MASPEKYCYERLKSKTNIRLVRLLPAGNQDEVLRVELHEHNQASVDGTYTALSYACGDTALARRVPVLCGQRVILIYPTLRSALLKLRRAFQPRIVWCDGLCIDQGHSTESLEERSLQVSMMSQIYSGAQEVLADLGGRLDQRHDDFVRILYRVVAIPDNTYLSVVPDTFGLLVRYEHPAIEDFKRMPDKEGWGAGRIMGQYSGLRSFLDKMPTEVLQRWLWQAFADLVSRPFFRRLWVVQEHALARKVVFLLGDTEILGPTFVTGLSRLFNIELVLNRTMPSIRSGMATSTFPFADKIIRIRHLTQLTDSESGLDRLNTMIYQTHRFECFDVRDMVYGVLGLCPTKQRQDPALRVDYNEPVGQLAQRISRYLLTQRSPFVLYRSIGCASLHEDTVPSWAINLSTRSFDHLSVLIGVDGTYHRNFFRAGWASTDTSGASSKAIFSTTDSESRHLTVKAILLPSLKSISPSGPPASAVDSSSLIDIRSWLLGLSAWIERQLPSTVLYLKSSLVISSTITADMLMGISGSQRASCYTDQDQLARLYTSFGKWMCHMDGSTALNKEQYDAVATESMPIITGMVNAFERSVACSEVMQPNDNP